MQTLSEFLKKHDVSIRYQRAQSNPHMDDSETMDNYLVTLAIDGNAMALYFSKGTGHKGAPPTVAEVLDCLADDASEAETAERFEDWAQDLGWDPDSRKVERTYNTILDQAAELRTLLGADAYNELLFETERD